MRIHCAKLTDEAVAAIIAYDYYTDQPVFNVGNAKTMKIADGDTVTEYVKSNIVGIKKMTESGWKYIGEIWIGNIQEVHFKLNDSSIIMKSLKNQFMLMDYARFRTVHYEDILEYMKHTDTDVFFTIGDEPYAGTVHEEA